MGILQRFQEYADAFEVSYADDDWSRIEEFFTENAVYEGEPDAIGRDAVMAKMKTDVDAFDRKMDSRVLSFPTPKVDGNELTVEWTVVYTKAGAPDVVIRGSETAIFEGERIARLRDDFNPEAQKALNQWTAKYENQLGG